MAAKPEPWREDDAYAARSRGAYVRSADCMEKTVFLLESASLVPDVAAELKAAGAAQLIIDAMNANAENDETANKT